jgi:hypothetical protein
MAGNANFDSELRMKLGAEQYRLNKSKAGRSGSSAGKPRPYAKRNILKARLFSPVTVGKSLTISPKHNYMTFQVGKHYEWEVVEEGFGYADNIPLEANEVAEYFFVIPKGRSK